MHAKTVNACWRIARRDAEAYQRRMNVARHSGQWGTFALCKAARDAADRIALRIQHGGKRRGR